MIKKLKNNLKSDKNFKELLSGSFVTLFLKSTGMLLSYLVVVLISRHYGAEGAGIYTLLLNLLISISIVCTLGLDVAILRYVGQYSNSGEGKNKIRAILNQAFKITFPFSLLMGIIIFSFSDFIANNIFKNEAYGDGIKIIAVTLPFYTFSLICIEFIRGLKKLKFSELLRAVIRPLIIIVFLFFFANFNDVIESIYALFVSIIILFISAVLFLIHYFHNNYVKLQETYVFSKRKLIKTSFPMMVIMVFTSILGNSASYFLEYYFDTEDVGVFNICFKIAQLISIILLVINTIAAPKFAELYWSNKKDDLKKLLNQTSILNLLGGFFVATILYIFSDTILGVFGEEFIEAKTLLLILIAGQTINCFLGSVSVLLVMIGHQRQLGVIIVLSTCFILFGYYFIVPEFGIIGAGIVSSIGYVLFNLFCVIYTYKRLKILPFNLSIIKDLKSINKP